MKQMSLKKFQEKGASEESALREYGKVFGFAFLLAFLMFLPFLIYDRGYFFYYGDFNVQQIPFYQLAHEAVRSGNFGFNFYTDLGVNFIGSYTFYLLGSPFFWLTVPFPNHILPYLMAPLLMLKTAVAALTSYGFIRRFVKTKEFALFGALMYAFSGFALYNIFFNHFHEAIAFFPLLLIALEQEMQEERRGVFALAVALCATVNYYFFVGQAVFLVIYFIARLSTGEYHLTWKKFFRLAAESILGVGASLFLMLPSLLCILQNPRTDDLLLGWDFWLYYNNQRYPLIIQSFFFPPDIPARPNFFPDSNAKWQSVSAYLPLFAMCGTMGWLLSKKKNSFKRIILVCMFFALVPGLNSLFFALNGSYTARWLYMLTLILSLVTVKALEDPGVDWKRGIRWCGIGIAFFALSVGLTPTQLPSVDENGEAKKLAVGLMDYPDRYLVYVVIAVVSLILVCLLFLMRRKGEKPFIRMTAVSLSAMILLNGYVILGIGKTQGYSSKWITEGCLAGREAFALPEGEFYRSDFYDSMDNTAMFWHIPSIQAFHSIVPGSVMEFYESIGVERGVASRPEFKHSGLRALTGVKYLYIPDTTGEDELPDLKYYTETETKCRHTVYSYDNYIGMGFTYPDYLTRTEFESHSKREREYLLLKALVVEDDDADTARKYMQPLDLTNTRSNDEALADDCALRREEAVSDFLPTRTGFTASLTAEKDNLCFFSVPWEKGWSAYVNGKEVPVYRCNIGFTAVPVTAGENEIEFVYHTPGLRTGLIASGISVLLFLFYLLVTRKSLPGGRASDRREDIALFEEEHTAYPADAADADESDGEASDAENPDEELPEIWLTPEDPNGDSPEK